MKGRIWFPVVVLCALLLPGPIPAREPVQAKLEQWAVPKGIQALPFHVGNDGVESNAALTGQGSFAAARVKTTAPSGCGAKYYPTIHSGDIDGDGVDELLARTPSGMEAWRFDTTSRTWLRLASGGPFADAASWDEEKYYATIHSADINGDGVDELLGRGADGMEAWRFNGTGWDRLAVNGPFPVNADDWDQEKYYATIHSADIDGDGQAELLARAPSGMEAWRFDGASWGEDPIASGGPFKDADNWHYEKYYATIHSADIDGDGKAELLGRGWDGMQAYDFESNKWVWLAGIGPFADANTWHEEKYYATIHSADIDGDGKAELLGRGWDGMQAWRFDGSSWGEDPIASGGPFADAAGWDEEKYYATIHSGDIDGDGVDELLGRGLHGMVAWRFNGDSRHELAGGGPFALEPRDGNYRGYTWANELGYKYPDWMARIPNDRRLSELSIPGTHESMAIHPLYWAALGSCATMVWYWMPICQQMYLENQLNSGIRALDIRVKPEDDRWEIYHGLVAQYANFGQVLDKVVAFLEAHPTETVLMRISPSQGKYRGVQNAQIFEWYMNQWHDGKQFSNWVWQPTTANPTLDEVRGKIVILDDFSEHFCEAVGEDELVDEGRYSSLALDSLGNPHISYHDAFNGILKYARWTGSGWDIQVVDGETGVVVGLYTSLALDDNDQPHVSYYDETNGNLKYAHLEASEWVTKTVDFGWEGADVGRWSSLALDGNNWPHISYYDATQTALIYAYPTGLLPGGGFEWGGFDTVDSGGDVGQYTSLALDSQDDPHISYYDAGNGDLKYARKLVSLGQDWDSEQVDWGSANDVGQYSSLALDAAGNPHISYYDRSGESQLDLKYVYKTEGGNWVGQMVDGGHKNDVGQYSSLALDSDGNPHISYYDNTSDDQLDLKYVYRTEGGYWVGQTVDSGGDVGLFTSLALDDNDQPHISYYDVDNGNLKYAAPSCVCSEGDTIITDHGLKYGFPCQFMQDDYQLNNHESLRGMKWPAVEDQLKWADERNVDKFYVNYLSGVDISSWDTDPVLPYFVASGHKYNCVLNLDVLTSGDHRGTDDTCCAGIDCASDYYPWMTDTCSGGECKVYYTGTNDLTTLYLRNHPPEGQPRRWGIIMADFPGSGLIDAIISANLVAPAAPSLSSPPSGGSTCDTTPAFQWSARNGAEEYAIQVDDNEDFSSALIDTPTPEASYTPDAALPLGTYYWRVRALSSLGDSDWSTQGQFAVVSTLPAPSLSSPPDGHHTYGRQPTFEWSPVSGSHRIQVDDDGDFASTLIDTTTSEANLPEVGLPLGTYYWRVMALADCGDSDWSPEWQLVHMGCVYLPLIVRE